VVLGVLLVPVAFVSPVGAGDTYAPSCGFVLVPPTITPEGQIHILGSAFLPGPVQFFIDGELLGATTANAEGDIDATFDLPAAFAAPGEYTITAACSPGGLVASNVLIVGGGDVTTVPLPTTGSDSTGGLARIGVGLLAVGALVLALARHRGREAVAA
jgi:hypothetical protein